MRRLLLRALPHHSCNRETLERVHRSILREVLAGIARGGRRSEEDVRPIRDPGVARRWYGVRRGQRVE